jgi:hypothetical protein
MKGETVMEQQDIRSQQGPKNPPSPENTGKDVRKDATAKSADKAKDECCTTCGGTGKMRK